MKSVLKDVLLILIMSIIVPGLLLNVGRLMLTDRSSQLSLPEITATISESQPSTETVIYVKQSNGTVVSMELENYLVGVVLGEMPAEFEQEALKAQAVVARTYTLRMREQGSKHQDADVCVNSECCQSYSDIFNGREYEKVRAAVDATAGLVLTYDGELIEATYFSSSGGRTEDAVAVWGNDVPYLRSTDSPEGEFADRYSETVILTKQEFADLLEIPVKDLDGNWLDTLTHTAGGGIDTVTIRERTYRGTELRKILGLRSTAFQIEILDNQIQITTRGYGHRVGMSQYGAEAMAVNGADFRQILEHYYQGTTLEYFVDKDSSIR